MIPVPHSDLNSELFRIQMKDFIRKLNEVIRNHNKAVVNREDTMDSADMYADCMYYDNKENENTYP